MAYVSDTIVINCNSECITHLYIQYPTTAHLITKLQNMFTISLKLLVENKSLNNTILGKILIFQKIKSNLVMTIEKN